MVNDFVARRICSCGSWKLLTQVLNQPGQFQYETIGNILIILHLCPLYQNQHLKPSWQNPSRIMGKNSYYSTKFIKISVENHQFFWQASSSVFFFKWEIIYWVSDSSACTLRVWAMHQVCKEPEVFFLLQAH